MGDALGTSGFVCCWPGFAVSWGQSERGGGKGFSLCWGSPGQVSHFALGSQGSAGNHLMPAVFSGSRGARHEAGAVHEKLMVCSWGHVLGAHGLETGDVLVSPTLLPPPAPIYKTGSMNPSKMTAPSGPLLSAHPYFTPGSPDCRYLCFGGGCTSQYRAVMTTPRGTSGGGLGRAAASAC